MNISKRKQAKALSKGLGDDIEKITKATGIEKIVKFVAGEDCGCDKRKEILNRLFPSKKPECMTEQEFNQWTVFREIESDRISSEEADMIEALWNRLFKPRKYYKPCRNCPQVWQGLIENINQVYETYQK